MIGPEFYLNQQLNKAIIWNKKSDVLTLLEQGADPFFALGTTDSPIYTAAKWHPELVSILLDPKNMTEDNRGDFKFVKNDCLLTAMFGILSEESFTNKKFLKDLIEKYKGDFSATIPFFYEDDTPIGLIFVASENHCAEPLEMLIQHGARDVKINWAGMNYGIHSLLEGGDHLREECFLKMLSLLLSMNPERINEYCYRFNGTCLDFFAKEKHRCKLFYKKHLNETIQMLVDAGGQAKPETWKYLSQKFGIKKIKSLSDKKKDKIFHEDSLASSFEKIKISEKEKSLFHLHVHNKKPNCKTRQNSMDVDISDEELLASAFGQSVVAQYRKPF